MNSFVETLKQLGPARLGIMGAMLVGLLLFFVFISFRVTAPEMKLLYADLSVNDSGAIAAKLEESQIRYEISQDGGRVTVPENDVGRARMLLAEAGLPGGGSLGYELFDKSSGYGTTNFVQNINQVRALEGELARTISSVESIRSARVHLVLPQRELFSRESRPSSASVFLGIRPGTQVTPEQILSIQSLVASAVPDLKPSNVTITDSAGNLLARGGDENNLLPMKAEELRRSFENNLTRKVMDQVSRIVGFDRVSATVTAEMNFDRISTNEELYDPETQVVRSSQVSNENSLERDPAPREVSVEKNLPNQGEDLLVGKEPTAENNRTEEITNYEMSKTVRNTVREVGDIKRLAVSVLVDGKYVTDDQGVKNYEPRSQDEIDRITALVRSAVGYDEKRGDTIEVVNLQFSSIDTGEDINAENLLFGFEKGKILDLVEIITVAVMIILVVLLVLQPMVNRLLASDTPEVDDGMEADLLAATPLSPALTGPGMDFEPPEMGGREESLIDIQGVEGKVKASSIKKVEEIVSNYPNETVAVIRSWMTQET